MYALMAIAIFIALISNLLIYSYFELEVMRQEERNAYLQRQIAKLNVKIKPIKEFNRQAEELQKKIEIIKAIDNKRDDSIAILRALGLVTPDRLYYTSVDISIPNHSISMRGVSAGPLYTAQLLDNLNNPENAFERAVLKSNDTSDKDTYNFEISASVNESRLLVEYESNGH